MSHLSPPSPDASLSPASPPHPLRRKRSSAHAALTSRPSILALRTAASSQASAAGQSESGNAVGPGIEGALAGLNIQGGGGVGASIEELLSLRRLIFAHLMLTTQGEDPAAAPDCQLRLALFQPDLLIDSAGGVYKLGREEWTAVRDTVERLRGLVKSGQPAAVGEQEVSSLSASMGKSALGLGLPQRAYRTSTLPTSQSPQSSWLILPPAEALDSTSTDGSNPCKVSDLITFAARYASQGGGPAEADTTIPLATAPSQIEDVLKLDPQALAGQPQGNADDEGGKKEKLRRVLDLFKAAWQSASAAKKELERIDGV